jgi:hypothetical protein
LGLAWFWWFAWVATVERLRWFGGRMPGVARRQPSFFCFAKRKKAKKGDPGACVPPLRCGQPAVLDSGGRLQNSLRSNNCSRADRLRLRSSAHSQGGGDNSGSGSKLAKRVSASFPAPACDRPVLAGPRSTGGGGLKGLQLFEPKASSADRRRNRAPQVARSDSAGTQTAGRLFLGYFLLAKQKKVTCRRATPASGLKPATRSNYRSPTSNASPDSNPKVLRPKRPVRIQ